MGRQILPSFELLSRDEYRRHEDIPDTVEVTVLYTEAFASWLQSLFSALEGGVGMVGRARSRYTPGRVEWYGASSWSTNSVQEGHESG